VSLEAKHSSLQIYSDGTIAAAYFDFVFFITPKVRLFLELNETL